MSDVQSSLRVGGTEVFTDSRYDLLPGPIPSIGPNTTEAMSPFTIDLVDLRRRMPLSVPELDAGPTDAPWTVLLDEFAQNSESRQGRRHVQKAGRRRELLITVSTWVRNVGALVILFAAWQLWGTAIAQHQSQATLQQQFAAKTHSHPQPPTKAGFSLLPATASVPTLADGTPMALMQIPKINLNQVIVSGTNENDLNKGPGYYVGTAMPGQAGNVAIAGHRTTHGAPFLDLGNLAPGDPIYLTDSNGHRLTYTVAVTPYPVSPSNVSVLNYFGDNRLTLTTCNPKYSAAQRLIVVAEYKPSGSAPPAHAVVAKDAGTPYKVTPSGEAGWNASLVPLVILEGGLLLALALANRRLSAILRRGSRWLVLVPVWAAGLFILFQTLTSFLPASA
jgi:sortase A